MIVSTSIINRKLSCFLRNESFCKHLNVRTLMSIQRDMPDRRLAKLTAPPNLTKLRIKDESDTKPCQTSLFKTIDSTNFGVGSSSYLQTVILSASYYNRNNSFLEKNQLKSDLIIDYKLKHSTDVSIELPSEHNYRITIEEPHSGSDQVDKIYITPTPLLKIISEPVTYDNAPIEEAPNGVTQIKKEAKRHHRMLKIRKKKMKVHRRKRLWKRMWSVWKKKFFYREKRREIEFRQKLIDKVRAAEKFKAEVYVDDYLEDYKFELTPKTYKRRKKPLWLVEELMERDVQLARREVLNKTNMKTNEPLIKEGESVEDFLDRTYR